MELHVSSKEHNTSVFFSHETIELRKQLQKAAEGHSFRKRETSFVKTWIDYTLIYVINKHPAISLQINNIAMKSGATKSTDPMSSQITFI